MQLPNGMSIVLGVALVAALTAAAEALPVQVPDWTGLAAAAVIAGVAKAIQVWLDDRQFVKVVGPDYDEESLWWKWLMW